FMVGAVAALPLPSGRQNGEADDLRRTAAQRVGSPCPGPKRGDVQEARRAGGGPRRIEIGSQLLNGPSRLELWHGSKGSRRNRTSFVRFDAHDCAVPLAADTTAWGDAALGCRVGKARS